MRADMNASFVLKLESPIPANSAEFSLKAAPFLSSYSSSMYFVAATLTGIGGAL